MPRSSKQSKSRSRRLLLAYLALLTLSHGVRWLAPPKDNRPADTQIAELAAIDAKDEDAKTTPAKLAYTDLPATTPDAPVLVLLHGSPTDAADWQPFTDTLSDRFRLILPQLYGSGASSPDLPDYSPAAAAALVDQLLQQLGIEKAHLAGFGTGGSTALHLVGRSPETVASLSLMAPLVIEELELVGDHTLNNTIYWAQKFYIWSGVNLLPHFGLLDRTSINLNYARHYYQSDPRRLATVLPTVNTPILLLHGERDLLRPVAASRELARILPQAELQLLEGRHKAPLAASPIASEAIANFISSVENGNATTRASASPERTALSQEPFEYDRYHDELRTRVLLMVILLAIATLISEDITCITAGILASRGVLGFFPATLGCFLGILIGDVGLYLIGRLFGTRALRVPPLKWMIKEEQVLASERFFERFGAMLVVVTRWLPGMRIPTYVAAGMLKLKLHVFLFYFIIAAAIWTPLLVGISTAVGGTLLGWLEKVEGYAPLILIAFIITVWIAAKFVVKAATRAFEKRAA
jgi:membrane protein DedA with SNARE-associated domain/pimeloyl-ACP methyl ester carboxylesterase